MTQPTMHESEAGQHKTVSFQLYEILKAAAPESLVIKDRKKQTVFTVRKNDSTFGTHCELMDANGTIIAKFKKNSCPFPSKWIVKRPDGQKLFILRNKYKFKKGTSIAVSCATGICLSLDMDRVPSLKGAGLAAEDVGISALAAEAGLDTMGPGVGALAAESGLLSTRRVIRATEDMGLASLAGEVGLGNKGDALPAELVSIFAKRASLAVGNESMLVEVDVGNKGNSLAVEGRDLASDAVVVDMPFDRGVREEEYKEKASGHRKFQLTGSWSGKTCAIYEADSKIKIAQMRPHDDNNTQGFMVEVYDNANLDFVIACFAAVEAMKSVEKKQKELLCHAAKVTGNGLCVVASHFCYQCCCN